MPTLRSIAATTLFASSLALSCMWYSETIVTEEIPFPTDLELISGNFPRHGQEYYRWVVGKREARIHAPKHNDSTDYDEWAWALEKLGKPDSAVNVMRLKRARFSNTYETMANLGTFLFHCGRLAEGLPYIDTAIRMNPEAHFGREIYQRYLVEYFLLRTKALPMEPATDTSHKEKGFADFVARKLGVDRLLPHQREKAIKGILGMMRFGDYRSPVLLEAWADLERGSSYSKPALGYLQAARRTQGSTAQGYRKLVADLPRLQVFSDLEKTLASSDSASDARFETIVAAERKWIQQGIAVDSAYRANFLVVKVKRMDRNDGF